MSIEARGINFSINNKFLFEEPVSFKLDNLDRVLLYGPSGYGKTTIFKMLSFLIQPSIGEIYYAKEHIKSFEYANKIRADYISLIPSNFSFFESLSIEDNITAPAYFARIQKRDIEDRLEYLYENFVFNNDQITLKNLRKKEISNLSNGQKEIIMIARAFMLKSKFIFADELLRSFNAIDKQDIFAIFKNTLEYFGNGLFMISHEDRFKEDKFINKIFSIEDQILKK